MINVYEVGLQSEHTNLWLKSLLITPLQIQFTVSNFKRYLLRCHDKNQVILCIWFFGDCILICFSNLLISTFKVLMVALNANVMIVCIAVKLSSERGSYVYSANSKYWKLQRILLLLHKLPVHGCQSAINHGHITYHLPNVL